MRSLSAKLLVVLVFFAQPGIGAATNLVLSVPTATDYMAVPDDYSLDLTNQFTLEAWVNVSIETEVDQAIVSKRRSVGGTSYALRIGKGYVVLGMNNDTGDGFGINFAVTSAREIEPGSWYHVAATYDGAEGAVFANGVRKAKAAVTMTLVNSMLPLIIGQEALPGDPRPFLGQIDEVRIWNRALSESEIRANMYSVLSGQEPNLVGYWNFNDSTAKDGSLYKNHGTFFGGAVTVPGSLPLLQIFTAVELVIPATLPGGNFQIQYSTNVPSQVWFDLGEPFQTDGNQKTFLDSVRGTEKRFYLEPCNGDRSCLTRHRIGTIA